MSGAPAIPRLTRLSAVEDVRADLLDHAQAAAPRRRDIIGVVPQDVGPTARHDIGDRQPGDALRPRPRGRTGVDRRELAVADERELRRLLDDAAPARPDICPTRRGS